ncbi:MAG: hypothetical protein JO154_20920 [Chitinophaga sp.]|uniref:hypothetical protein n=1 Tax=Chitinophaga sp. TaxID=1869181 RepID=UPI0025BF228E|nr:hypothetical protein [Chitinophaga sp.]MBV8255077.1 hypothetical protein [Chitinophaga sp.]
MVRKLCCVLLALCPVTLVYAQQEVVTLDLKRDPVATRAVRAVMLDSILKKYPMDTALHKAGIQSGFQQYVSRNYGTQELSKMKDASKMMSDSLSAKKYFDTRLRSLYAMKDNFPGLSAFPKHVLGNKFGGANAAITYNNAPGNIAPVQVTGSVNDQVTLMNIPFDVNYTYHTGQPWDYQEVFARGMKQVSFNKEEYVERLSKQVNKSFDVNKYFLQDINVSDAVKKYLQNKLDEVKTGISHLTGDSTLRDIISPEELIYLDSAQIKNVLSSNQTIRNFHPTDSSSMQQYLDKIYALKAQVAKDKTVQRLISSQDKLNKTITGAVENPESKKDALRSLLPLNFMQKLFLQMRSLQIGNLSGEGNGLTKDLFLSGLQGSLLANNKFVMLGLGSRNDARDLKNIGLNNSMEPGSFAIQFMQLGTGDLNGAHTHVGVLNANSRQQGNSFNMPVLPRNIFVGAVSEQIDLGQYGVIAAELEKSNVSLKNVMGDNNSLLASKVAAAGMFNDFMETMSFGLDYNGELKSWNLSQRAYAKFSGMAYSNPGSPGSTRGSVKYGVKLDRQFQKRRIAVGFRMDRQDTRIAAMGDSKWKNSQLALDFRMRVKKNLSVSSRIAQSMMKGVTDSTSSTGYVNRNITVSSQWNGRLFAVNNATNATFSLQQVDVAPVKSVLLNMNLNHNIILGSHLLSVNVMYNKDLRDEALYGNLMTAETSWSYKLTKLLNCSSGITYLNNKAVVQQAGVRQTIGANLMKRMDVNLFLDCRKNLQNTTQNYLFGTFTTSLAIHYQLN